MKQCFQTITAIRRIGHHCGVAHQRVSRTHSDKSRSVDFAISKLLDEGRENGIKAQAPCSFDRFEGTMAPHRDSGSETIGRVPSGLQGYRAWKEGVRLESPAASLQRSYMD